MCTLYCFLYDTIHRETNEHITIHDGYVKVPYTYQERVFYMIVPTQMSEHQHDMLRVHYHKNKSNHDPIYYNSIIESGLKLSGTDTEIDISTLLERFMGPDQCYKNQKKLIKIKDVIPLKYHTSFQYVRLLYDDLESITKNDLDECIFE
jgi:hypothetical protein